MENIKKNIPSSPAPVSRPNVRPVRSERSDERKGDKMFNMSKKAVLIMAGVVLLALLGGYFLVSSLVSSKMKKFYKETETIVNDDRVLIYTDPAASTTDIVSQSDLKNLNREDREKILNDAVDDATNIRNTTGITDSGSGSDFKPVITGGIISGVATGTGALPTKTTAGTGTGTGTGTVAPSSGDLQDEIEAIRNGGN